MMRKSSNGNSWFSAVKNAFKSPSTDNKRCRRKDEIQDQEAAASAENHEKTGKRKWIFGKHRLYFPTETTIHHKLAKTAITICSTTDPVITKHPQTDTGHIAIAVAKIKMKSRNEAALTIQTIFRGYLARRALSALKGVVKMQALIRGYNVRKRANTTLRCIQSLVRVQALVCDQRRRISCDATMYGQNLDLEELQALIQKSELRQGNTLAHILSNQDPGPDSDYQMIRKDRSLCSSIKTVEMDTSRPHSFTPPKPFKPQNQDSYYNNIPSVYNSPRTPSTKSYYQAAETPTSRAIYLHRMSLCENTCPLPLPSYMEPTQSAIARVRSHSTPRQRVPLSPNRQQTGTARKRLSFPVSDGHY